MACALATSLFAGAPRAESPPWDSAVYCPDPEIAPTADGRTVPGNTPAFPIVADSTNDGFELRTSTGAIVPTRTDGGAALGISFLVPLAPLAEGAYAIHWRSKCKTTATPDGTFSRSFVAGPSAPLPTKSGSLTIVRPAETYGAEYCGNVQVQTVLGAELDAALKPFAETTKIVFETARGYYPTPSERRYGNAADGARARVRAYCMTSPGFAPDVGPRPVTMTAQLAGLPVLPTASLDLDLECDPVVAAKCIDAVSLPDAGTDASTDAGADEAREIAPSAQGCAAGRQRGATSAWLAGLVVGVGVGVGRWRRGVRAGARKRS